MVASEEEDGDEELEADQEEEPPFMPNGTALSVSAFSLSVSYYGPIYPIHHLFFKLLKRWIFFFGGVFPPPTFDPLVTVVCTLACPDASLMLHPGPGMPRLPFLPDNRLRGGVEPRHQWPEQGNRLQ